MTAASKQLLADDLRLSAELLTSQLTRSGASMSGKCGGQAITSRLLGD